MNYLSLQESLPPLVFEQLTDCITKFNINNRLRLAHFLGQCAHESRGFTRYYENLNYDMSRLIAVFPKYFQGVDMDKYIGSPQAIANRVYADRMGNGDESSGDGYRYRGRGFIQLTGKNNYAAFDKVVPDNILMNPDLVAIKYPLLSAAWFWDHVGANVPAGQDDGTSVTKKINGGTNGLEDRLKRTSYFYRLIED